MKLKYLILKIFIFIFLIIYFLKPLKNYATIKKLKELNLVKNNKKIFLFENKYDGFYINKNNYKKNKKIFHNDIVYYNNGIFINCFLEIGDILIYESTNFLQKIIKYISNSEISHVAMISNFKVNKTEIVSSNSSNSTPSNSSNSTPSNSSNSTPSSSNNLSDKVSIIELNNNYYKIDVNLINSSGSFKTKENEIKKGVFELKLKDDFFYKKKIHVIKNKNITNENKIKISEIFKFFYSAKYNYYSVTYHSINSLKSKICNFFQRLSNTEKNLCTHWLSYSNPNSNEISFELLLKYRKNLNFLYSKLKKEKNKKKLYDKILRYNKIINKKIVNRYFNCSEFVYYIYFHIGIDLFKYKRLGENVEAFSKNIIPAHYEELLQNNEYLYKIFLYN